MNYKLNWSEAAKYGFLSTLLKAVKLCASVYIVYYAMRRNADSWDYVRYGQSFGYGMAVCTLSAIVCTLFVLLTYTVFIPGSLTEMLDQIFQTYEHRMCHLRPHRMRHSGHDSQEDRHQPFRQLRQP